MAANFFSKLLQAALDETVAQAAKFEEMRQAGGNYGEEGFQPSKGKDGERRSRMFAGRKEGRGRRDRGDAGRGGQTAAAVSTFVSNRTTASGGAATLVDVGAEVEDLKAKGHTVDDDANALAQVGSLSLFPSLAHTRARSLSLTRACSHAHANALAQEVAAILALNPTVSPTQKRAFVRRFIKNSARADEEFKQVLEM